MPPARASRHQRERTPRGEEEITPERLEYLRDAFNKSREQHRGGDNHRRRLKGLCCGILRFLIQVLAGYIAYRPTQPQTPSQERAYHHRQRAFKRRKEEAENCLWWITAGGWLPRRDQNLLDPGEYELDSELGEPIVISDDEDEEDLSSHQQDIGQRQLGPWINSNTASGSSDDRAARIRAARVSLDNPLLVSRPLIDHDQLSRAGVQINPPLRHRLRCDVVVSIDWHQVLDTIRLSKYKTLRVDTSSGWYTLLQEVKQRLVRIRELAHQKGIRLAILVLSYTHSLEFRNRVLGLLPWEAEHLDCAITTEERVGQGGKVWALDQVVEPNTRVWHLDDSPEICREIFEGRRRHQVNIRAAGIKVPNHWRRQREVTGVFWYQNVLEAFDTLAETFEEVF